MDTFAFAASTFFILLVSLISYSWIFKNSKNKQPPLPLGPRGLPILGYLPFLQVNLHHQFTELAHKYGPIYKLWLGSKLCFVVSSSSLVKEIVRDHDTIFANRDPPIAALVATGGVDIFWSPYGQYWRDMRKLFVRQMLSNNNLQASYSLRKDAVRKVVDDIRGKINKPINVGEMVFAAELNVVFGLLWGSKTNVENPGADLRDNVLKFIDLLGKPNVSDYVPYLAKFDLQGVEKEMRNVLLGIEGALDTLLNGRLKMMENGRVEGEERSKDFLGILLELKEEEKSISMTQIKAILMDIIVGGSDTSATITEWVMAEILNNPNVMKKVQKELTAIIGMNNLVEESHIPKLQYLDAVVKETFRVHPPLPLLVPRYNSESCTIGGYTIPKHSRVFLNMWFIYNDPNVWENPLEFRPERFLNDRDKFDYAGNNVEYLPFGSGRRVCPGISLAEKMIMYLLATLLYSFDWKLLEGEKLDLTEKFGIVMKKHSPLIAVPFQKL